MDYSLFILVLLVTVALAFDFMNGFHDAANSIATVVSTGVLRPLYAVGWAASFNFVAYFIFQTKVAATIGTIPWELLCRLGARIQREYC